MSHSNLALMSDTALTLPDSPFSRCTISFIALVWSPRVGMKLSTYFHEISSESTTHKLLEGRINLCSPDHVSLLVHRTFNVSIPRQHLPFEEYEFEYGPAENDPEFGVRIASEGVSPGPGGAGEDQRVRDPGRWVHRTSSDPLGGDGRTIEFTIIGCVQRPPALSTHIAGNAQQPAVWFSVHLKQILTILNCGSPVIPPFPTLPRADRSLQYRMIAWCAIARTISVFLRNKLGRPEAPARIHCSLFVPSLTIY